MIWPGSCWGIHDWRQGLGHWRQATMSLSISLWSTRLANFPTTMKERWKLACKERVGERLQYPFNYLFLSRIRFRPKLRSGRRAFRMNVIRPCSLSPDSVKKNSSRKLMAGKLGNFPLFHHTWIGNIIAYMPTDTYSMTSLGDIIQCLAECRFQLSRKKWQHNTFN